MNELDSTDQRLLPKSRLDDLIRLLMQDGYEVIGPQIDQEAIVYGPLRSARELPIGWTDRQSPGTYRLQRRADDWYFAFAVGPHSWKKYLFPPTLQLWEARKTADGFAVQAAEPDPPRRALLGVRSCELHAIAVQDRVFLNRDGQFTDPYYARARERLLLIAVECQHPAGTCFCTSMGTGPAVTAPRPIAPETQPVGRVSLPVAPAAPPAHSPFFDLALIERSDGFVVRAGSEAGQKLLDRLILASASPEQVNEAHRDVAAVAGMMGRTLDTTDIQGLLHGNPEHPRWSQVAERCLACTNCTLVCPTCFCSNVEDVTDLGVESAQRVRHWDSCFNPEFAHVHGGNYRPSIRGRYRQWLTHKFASWFDQFGTSGCVGCGRCITWCPVGIDVTEEIAAIRASDGRPMEKPS